MATIVGRQPVREALRAKRRTLHEVWLSSGIKKRDAKPIIDELEAAGVSWKWVASERIEEATSGMTHQGILAFCNPYPYVEVSEILMAAQTQGVDPFIVMACHIEDPHNLGALIRSSEAAGAHGLIIPKRRSASINATVVKTSAGATEHLRISQVTNLVRTLKYLKSQRIWAFGAEAKGKSIYSVDLSGPVVLCLGSEAGGLPRLVNETCDELVSLPLFGRINSLNVSVAGAVLLYEIVRSRYGGPA